MDKPACTEIANDYDLWGEYVDVEANMTEAEFNDMGFDARLALIHDLWPRDCNCAELEEQD